MLNSVELAGMVAVIVQLIKPYAELWLKPSSVLHDNTLRVLAVLLGVAALAAQQGLPGSSAAALQLVYNGGAIGLGAIAGYHAATGVLPAAIQGAKNA